MIVGVVAERDRNSPCSLDIDPLPRLVDDDSLEKQQVDLVETKLRNEIKMLMQIL